MENEDVIYDNTVHVEIDDEVKFISGGKKYIGNVKMYSDNYEELKIRQAQLENQQKIRVDKNCYGLQEACSTKRIPKKRDFYSPEKENSTKKTPFKNLIYLNIKLQI
ncbi:uncharacterized protein LOC113005371 [Solenopsis invicta]|uniref:uncharacterized protein LOC113005371 n=1 Tax=Solenopsis invicta TaxID=13686 RepID=UPI000E340019|nr:uncharacterized protein LOC113005371 [Solenopsis invicta]